MPDARAAMAQTLATQYGLPIIFLRDGDKRPLHKGEFEAQATRDRDRIQAELGNGSNRNYGIAWGPVADKFALDVDAGGVDTIASLEWELGPLPPTWRILTQSGAGYQDIFPWPHDGGPPIRNRGRFAPSLDVRGQGGQSVGPLSEFVDKATGEVRQWRWAPGRAPWEIDLAEMPAAWLALIRAHSERPEPKPVKPAPLQARNRLEAFAASVMQAKLDALAAAPDGEQEQRLGHAALKAGSLIARGWISQGWCEQAILATLLACPTYRPGDPWTYSDGAYKVARAIEHGLGNPEPDPVWLAEIEDRERPRDHLRGINGGKANGSTGIAGEEPWPEPEPNLKGRLFRATPLADLPTRQWLYGRHYIRRYVSCTVAPPGTGKSMLALQEAMAMASGKPILGQACERRRVWYWNGEDPLHESQLRAAATMKHYGLTPEDLEGWFIWGSGREHPIMLASIQGRGSPAVDEGMVADVVATIEHFKIDVVIIDPFVSSHRVAENDNMAVDLVVKTWARIAERCNVAVELVHHPRKVNGEQVTIDDSRGGGALVAGARVVRLLNPMTEAEAIGAGLTPAERRSRFRVDHGKANLAPPSIAAWFRFISIDLENGPEGLGDSVGVIVPWSWPNAFAGVTAQDTLRVQQAIDAGRWRKDWQARDWVGYCVARTLGFDPPGAKTPERQRILVMLKTWFDHGLLTTEDGLDDHGQRRTWVIVGKLIDLT